MHDIPKDKFFALIKWLYLDKGEKAKWVMESQATEEHTSPGSQASSISLNLCSFHWSKSLPRPVVG